MRIPPHSCLRFLASVAIAFVALADIAASAAEPFTPAQFEFFEKKIRPVLATHCHECHSAKAKKPKAGLRLDNFDALLRGGDSGPAIVAGDPAKSLLHKAVRYGNPDTAMPPKAKLEDKTIADIEDWIKMGAPWPAEAAPSQGPKTEWNWAELRAKHWAFQPMRRSPPPNAGQAGQIGSPVDRFILARLEAEGLTPAPRAERRELIRRASFDLTGLPPTLEETEAFVRDERPDAFRRLLERLLASPRYGERWARHWLDVARYSDGLGGFLDGAEKRAEAWRYRDWVVNAMNEDMPFDLFVKSQIAGDHLGEASVTGTGFLALGPSYQSDGGTEEGKAVAQSETLDDRVDTVTRGLLGLTVSCARCHDHKFDPIPTADYYSLAGVFQNTRNDERVAPGTPRSVIDLYDQGQKAIRDCEKELASIREGAKQGKRELTLEEKGSVAEKEKELERLRKTAPPKYPVVHAVADSGTANMRVALRGNLLKPGEVAPRRFLRIVAGEQGPLFSKGSGRLELAEAIVDPENPLTARVLVNRVWLRHFGRGLVRTPDNFGTAGDKPTHPALLDWLARSLVDSGWSLKKLHLTIMLSEAYQRSSRGDPRNLEKDAENRFYWRMEPRRLDVEAWRDGLLAVTEGLDLAAGGPSAESILASPRRTLYAIVSQNGDRFESDEFLRLFDLPSARATSPGRNTSIVPQQFLFMMNNPFMVARAKELFPRVGNGPAAERIRKAYLKLYGRPPSPEEQSAGEAFLNASAPAGGEPPAQAWDQYAQALLSGNEFLFVR